MLKVGAPTFYTYTYTYTYSLVLSAAPTYTYSRVAWVHLHLLIGDLLIGHLQVGEGRGE